MNMASGTHRLGFVYDGWDGYHGSLVRALAPLSPEQLAFRPGPETRSVAELGWHIADGRVDWFRRMEAPGSDALWSEVEGRRFEVPRPLDAAQLTEWLDRTWAMVQATLDRWTVEDLAASYHHPYGGKVYAVSRQWTVWRILTHDVHHGGQLSTALALQGIVPLELTLLGGHVTEPPIVGSAP